MAGVVDLCREQWQNVTLYVNDYNTPARALYRRVGFDEVGAMATVLYCPTVLYRECRAPATGSGR
jgi:uncharacterized protein